MVPLIIFSSHYFGIANTNANSIANAQCERTLRVKSIHSLVNWHVDALLHGFVQCGYIVSSLVPSSWLLCFDISLFLSISPPFISSLNRRNHLSPFS